jgi:hypothetical protein
MEELEYDDLDLDSNDNSPTNDSHDSDNSPFSFTFNDECITLREQRPLNINIKDNRREQQQKQISKKDNGREQRPPPQKKRKSREKEPCNGCNKMFSDLNNHMCKSGSCTACDSHVTDINRHRCSFQKLIQVLEADEPSLKQWLNIKMDNRVGTCVECDMKQSLSFGKMKIWENRLICLSCYRKTDKQKKIQQLWEEVHQYWVKNNIFDCDLCKTTCIDRITKEKQTWMTYENDHISLWTKGESICNLVWQGSTIDVITAELCKCRLLCSDCHVLVTLSQHLCGSIQYKKQKTRTFNNGLKLKLDNKHVRQPQDIHQEEEKQKQMKFDAAAAKLLPLLMEEFKKASTTASSPLPYKRQKKSMEEEYVVVVDALTLLCESYKEKEMDEGNNIIASTYRVLEKKYNNPIRKKRRGVMGSLKSKCTKDGKLNEIKSLNIKGTSREVPALIEFLNHSVPNYRRFSASGLGKIGDVRALEPLQHLEQVEKNELVLISVRKAVRNLLYPK